MLPSVVSLGEWIMKRVLVLLALAGLLLGACSSSSDDDDGEATTEPAGTEAAATESAAPDPTEAATAEPTVEPTEEPAAGNPSDRPETVAEAALGIIYNTAGGEFDADVMGFGQGDVRAQWYQAEGFYVVVYEGLDLDAAGPLCPGNSIQLASGAYDFVSNAPTERYRQELWVGAPG